MSASSVSIVNPIVVMGSSGTVTQAKTGFNLISSGLYTFDSEIRMTLTTVALRSTAVRLRDGGVVLISPPNPKKCDYGSLKAIGPVTHILAPNLFHNLFVPSAHAEFPDAKLWAAPGLEKKKPQIPWNAVIGHEPWPFAGELEAIHIDGIPQMSEVVFLHHASRTLITTDLFFNVKGVENVGGKFIFSLMGTLNKLAVSRLTAFLTKNKVARNKSIEQMMQWDFERLIMAHGNLIDSNAKPHAAAALKERLGLNFNLKS